VRHVPTVMGMAMATARPITRLTVTARPVIGGASVSSTATAGASAGSASATKADVELTG